MVEEEYHEDIEESESEETEMVNEAVDESEETESDESEEIAEDEEYEESESEQLVGRTEKSETPTKLEEDTTDEENAIITLPTKKFNLSNFNGNFQLMDEGILESYETKDNLLSAKYDFKGTKIIFQFDYNFYLFLKNLEEMEGVALLHDFIAVSPSELIPSFVILKERSGEEFVLPRIVFDDIQKGKILFPEPTKTIEPEPKIEKPSVKKEAIPDKAKNTVDEKEVRIKELESELRSVKDALEETEKELSILQDKDEERIESRSLDDFFEDVDDDELEKRIVKIFGEVKFKGNLAINKKDVDKFLWNIIKDNKKVSEQSLKNFISSLRQELVFLYYQIDLYEQKQVDYDAQVDKLTKELESEKKQKEDALAENKVRRQQVSDLLKMPVEAWEDMVKEPAKKGYNLPSSQYQVLKYLSTVDKADWKMLEANLIGAGKFHSLSTLSTALNALKLAGFVVKVDKFYKITKDGLNALHSFEGVT